MPCGDKSHAARQRACAARRSNICRRRPTTRHALGLRPRRSDAPRVPGTGTSDASSDANELAPAGGAGLPAPSTTATPPSASKEIMNSNTTSKSRLVTGLFPDRTTAERAYGDLTSRGYGKDDVHLVMSDDTRKRYFNEGS